MSEAKVLRILVVDDYPDRADSLSTFLRLIAGFDAHLVNPPDPEHFRRFVRDCERKLGVALER